MCVLDRERNHVIPFFFPPHSQSVAFLGSHAEAMWNLGRVDSLYSTKTHILVPTSTLLLSLTSLVFVEMHMFSLFQVHFILPLPFLLLQIRAAPWLLAPGLCALPSNYNLTWLPFTVHLIEAIQVSSSVQ